MGVCACACTFARGLQVILTSILWGIGTAIGEIPPYWISFSAAVAGQRNAALAQLEEVRLPVAVAVSCRVHDLRGPLCPSPPGSCCLRALAFARPDQPHPPFPHPALHQPTPPRPALPSPRPPMARSVTCCLEP
jgi:hypothetical protein